MLVSKGQRAAESNRAEKRASDHEGAPALEPQLALGRRAGRRQLPSVEEIGIETLALVVILRRAPWRFGRTKRDLRRLIVDCVESLQLPPRIDLRHALAVILRRFVGEEFKALIGFSALRIVGAGAMGILPARLLALETPARGNSRPAPAVRKPASAKPGLVKFWFANFGSAKF